MSVRSNKATPVSEFEEGSSQSVSGRFKFFCSARIQRSLKEGKSGRSSKRLGRGGARSRGVVMVVGVIKDRSGRSIDRRVGLGSAVSW